MNIPLHLQEALKHLRSGQVDAAEALLRQVVAADRKNFDGLHLLGICLHHRREFEGAERHIRAALGIRPAVAPAHLSHGNALRELGRIRDAISSYRRAAQLDPSFAPAHINLGLALEAAGDPGAALASIDRALAIQRSASALCARADLLLVLGRRPEAIAQYREAIATDPAHAGSHANLAAVLAGEAAHRELAMVHADEALRLEPGHIGALRARIRLLNQESRGPEALEALARLPAADRRDPEVRLEEARALQCAGQISGAIAILEEILRGDPEHHRCRLALACALAMVDRFAESEAQFAELEKKTPGDALLRFNRGLAAYGRGDLSGARAAFSGALEREPGIVGARFNISTIDLLELRFEPGWRGFEFRWEVPAYARSRRSFPRSLWLGEEDLAGRTLLVWAEQGLGDLVQFVRFLPGLAARCARVIAEVPVGFVPLLRRSLPAEILVIARGAAPPPFDFHIPMLSLGLALGLRADSDFGAAPYLRADPLRVAIWEARLGESNGPRLGLAWSGNPQHVNDARRSLALSRLMPWVQALRDRYGERGFRIVALQIACTPDDRETLAEVPELLFFGEAIRDLEDTAALIQCCERVVSVDTLAVHLTGAMGRPARVLLAHTPDVPSHP